MKLNEHRNIMKKNKDFLSDIERCKKTLVNHLMSAGYYNLPENLLDKYISLIFSAQNQKPFFYYENKSGIPVVWNSPRDWDKKYYRYEWGHLHSKNQNGIGAHNIENLALLSARGNQHIQTSLDIEEVLDIFKGSKIECVVAENLAKRERLFSSDEWNSLKTEMKKYWAPTEGQVTKNSGVVSSFIEGAPARAGSLHTNNGKLYSYNRVISYKNKKTIFIHNYTSQKIDKVEGIKSSKTTAGHVNYILKKCKKLKISYEILPGTESQTFKRKRGTFKK